jgi:hypothetical protein
METKLEVKRIELWSLFKIAFFIYAAIGLVVGMFYGFFLLLATALENALIEEGFPDFGLIGGVLGLVLIPVIALFYGAIGSVFVTIVGFLYNLFAGFVGGVRFDTQVAVGEPPPVPGSREPDDSPPTI